MPATDAPYRAADAVEDARLALRRAGQHAPFAAEAAAAFCGVADAYARLATVLARHEPGDKDHACEWRTVARRALRERERETERADTAEVRAGQAEELLSVAHETSNKSEAERARAAQRADKVEHLLAETREEMFRLGSLLAKQCDRIDAAEAAGYPMLGNRYLDRNGEEWTVGANGLMHHHSYSQRSFEEVRREYGPLKRNDMPAMVRADGVET